MSEFDQAERVFAIAGEPVPWAPTKRNQRTGNRFLPARQEEAIARNVAAINHTLGGEGHPLVFEPGVPLLLSCTFYVKRNKGDFLTAKAAQKERANREGEGLRDSAPARPTGRPDLSNLAKMIEDCLVLGGVMLDDDQVVGHYSPFGKVFAAYWEQPRTVVRIKKART